MKLYYFIVLFFSVSLLAGSVEESIKKSFVSFEEAMKPYPGAYTAASLHDKKFGHRWRILKDLYDRHIIKELHYSDKPKIPKIIHHIWVGSPIPSREAAFRQTFLEKHPDWECRLWTDKEIDELGLENRAMYDKTSNYGEKSDIARYEIIYRYGGVYLDTDFECFKPLDILHHCCDFYASIHLTSGAHLANGLIAASPNNIILRECIDSLKRAESAGDSYQEILHRTGPMFFTDCFYRKINECEGAIVPLPMSYFLPWPFWLRKNRSPHQIEKWIKPYSFANHHWHVSWNNGKEG